MFVDRLVEAKLVLSFPPGHNAHGPLLSLVTGLLPLEVLDDLEDEGVLSEDPEHVDDAGHYPGLHRGQALRL